MTARADLNRLGLSTITLGELLRDRGEEAWDHMKGWEWGPRKAPAPATDDDGHGYPDPAAEDRAIEMKQRQAAARHFAEHRDDLAELNTLVQRITRRIDVACPPNLGELKNRRTGELDPITPADAAVDGWCRSCWRLDQAHVPITVARSSGLRYYRDLCRPCGDFEKEHGIEKPLEILAVHLDGKRLSPEETDRIIAKAKAAAAPKKKGKNKGKRGKKAA